MSHDIDFTTLTLRDTLDLAIAIEEEAKERYDEFAEQLEAHHSPEVAKFFRFMSDNEIKHAEQLQLYMVAVFLRYPKVQKVITEAWYLDKDEITQIVYSRKQLPRYLKTFNNRGIKFTSMTEFLPTPSYKACAYCPYKTGQLGKSGVEGTEHCDANPDA